MAEYLTNVQRKHLLDISVIPGDFILASGERAKQKFDFDLVNSDSDIFNIVVSGLANCIRDNFSDYQGILTVANGATRLGEPLSKALSIPCLNSSYSVDESANKHFSVNPVLGADRVVVVDDVFTRGTNTTKVALAAREHQIEPLGAVVVLDRSGYATPSILNCIAVASLIRQELG